MIKRRETEQRSPDIPQKPEYDAKSATEEKSESSIEMENESLVGVELLRTPQDVAEWVQSLITPQDIAEWVQSDKAKANNVVQEIKILEDAQDEVEGKIARMSEEVYANREARNILEKMRGRILTALEKALKPRVLESAVKQIATEWVLPGYGIVREARKVKIPWSERIRSSIASAALNALESTESGEVLERQMREVVNQVLALLNEEGIATRSEEMVTEMLTNTKVGGLAGLIGKQVAKLALAIEKRITNLRQQEVELLQGLNEKEEAKSRLEEQMEKTIESAQMLLEGLTIKADLAEGFFENAMKRLDENMEELNRLSEFSLSGVVTQKLGQLMKGLIKSGIERRRNTVSNIYKGLQMRLKKTIEDVKPNKPSEKRGESRKSGIGHSWRRLKKVIRGK